MSTSTCPLSPSLSARVALELRRLRIPGHLRGSGYLTYMLAQVIPDPDRLQLITKNLYPETGLCFSTTVSCVERNARHAVHSSWNNGGRGVLEQMADAPLERCPTVSEFLHIVSDYIRRTA